MVALHEPNIQSSTNTIDLSIIRGFSELNRKSNVSRSLTLLNLKCTERQQQQREHFVRSIHLVLIFALVNRNENETK